MAIKNSAIPYAGYEYQTLYGVLLLANWLNNPTEYKRICFEADAIENEAPQGIDDIVCERSDGKVDYRQVKFTPNPDNLENAFTWEWLLKRSGKTERSRSILKKISDAVSQVQPDKLGNVFLITNKIPNREIETCLKNGKLNFDLIEPARRSEIIQQLGNENTVRNILSTLQILHSEGNYRSIYRTVQSELAKHSHDDGVDRLLNRAREWAIHKNQPSDNGWIALHNIRDILSRKRPEPIPETFSISESYCLPDEVFHKKLLTKISVSDGNVFTITGSPGRGKSTYLSYLCQELEKLEIPIIRHHYFLSLNDQTIDRLSPRVIAESLLMQINSNHQDVDISSTNAEDLRNALEKCAVHYKKQKKPFVLIVDGLDHVWRDNDGNKKPLDDFFRVLLPVPENLILLVGTQPVDETKLPKTLLEHCPQETWEWLPTMTGNSIYQYLHFQIDSGRLHINCHEEMVKNKIKEAAEKLLSITSGYPLHVIYSCEYLVQSGKPLSSWTLEHLPTCENSDITSYYQSLWRRLTHKQKDVLHLCCAFQFSWPRESFTTILNESLENTPSLYAVSFLLFETKSGVQPFHESLIVFIRNTEEHNMRIASLIENVCNWLNHQAPEHLKNSWYWLCLAKQGDSIPLREGVTRDWILDRVSEGYSLQTLIRLLENAENIAFQELQYAEAYKHRALKTRLLNGPEFQIWDFPTLEMLSLYNASASIMDLELSLYRDFTPKRLATLSIALWQRRDFDRAKDLAKKAIDKHRSQIKFTSRIHRNESDAEAHVIIKAGVLSDVLDYAFIFANENFANWPESYIKAFRNACLIKGDMELMLKAMLTLEKSSEGKDFELSAIRTSILEGSDLFAWQEFLENKSHPASIFLELLKDRNFKSTNDYFADYEDCKYYQYTYSNYHEWFFTALTIKLRAEGNFSWLPAQTIKERMELTFYLNALTELASNVAELLINFEEVEFHTVSYLLSSISFPDDNSFDIRRETILFKRDWLEISADIHLLTTQRHIKEEELQEVITEDIFLLEWIRLWYSDVVLKIFSDDAAILLLENVISKQLEALEDASERTNDLLALADIAQRHDHKKFVTELTRLCWDYTIGYGNHKDTTIFNVLDAIDCLSETCPSEALAFLQQITPIVFNISKFTDGDETRHSLTTMSTMLAKLNPNTLASKYTQEIRDGEWHDADTSLSALLEDTDFSSDIVGRFCLTGLSRECHQIITKKAESGDKNAEIIIMGIQNLLGTDLKSEDEEKKSDIFGEQIDIDPALYPPDHLAELENALVGKYSTYNFWPRWYSYWVEHGKEQELLQILPEAISKTKDKLDDKKYLYDLLFYSSKKFNGKTKSFEFLVAAQISMGGWLNWHEQQENSLKRLKNVATLYPDRVDEFITATTTSLDVWYSKTNEQIIPGDKLVYLLVEAGRTNEAMDFIIAIIEKLEEDTRNLNLPTPHWDWNVVNDIDEVFINLLVSRLKWPVPTIKLWVSQQLAELLVEVPEKMEGVLVSALSSCEQESECIEVLTVFLIAKNLGYNPREEIGKFIYARSILSDMLIEYLELTEKGIFSTKFTPLILISHQNNNFEKAQGRDVPLIYKSTLEEEQEKTDIPFVEFYKSEWNRTFKYAPTGNSDISYFFGSERESATGQFYTNSSHRGRSAFLRSIEIGRQCFGMPDHYAEDLAILALPIEPTYLQLKPNKPSWLPEWMYGDNTSEETLFKFINESISNLNNHENNFVLGALSFPIQIEQNKWLDFKIVRGVVLDERGSGKIIKDRMNGYSIGEKLNRHISYVCKDLDFSKIRNIIPLTGSMFPLARYGHWHSDIEGRGIYIPLTYAEDRTIKAFPFDSELQFLIDEHIIGKTGYWNHHWGPIHPKDLNSLCGTYTLLSLASLDNWLHEKFSGLKQILICEISHIHRDSSYGAYKTNKILFTIPTI